VALAEKDTLMKTEPDSSSFKFKPITLNDKPFLAKLLKNPHIAQNFIKGSEYVDSEVEDILDKMLLFWVNNRFGFYVVHLQNNPIGIAGFNYLNEYDEVEIVYCLDESYWGQGLATPMVNQLMEIGFNEFNLNKILGIVKCENSSSLRVLQKLNFNLLKTFNEKSTNYFLLERTNQLGVKKQLYALEVGL
jgi:RimJ/RimL family protein N-acetyltransferase